MRQPSQQRHFDGEPYAVAEVYCDDTAWKCGCGLRGETLVDLQPVGDCALTPGDPSPAGRCPGCDALVVPETPTNATDWVTPVPVLSTAHITFETTRLLNAAAANTPGCRLITVCAGYCDGWFLRVPEEEEPARNLPADLVRIFAWSRRKKYQWIRLDSIGVVVPEMLTYSW